MPIYSKYGRMQFWGTAKNPDWTGTAFDTDCCPCECGCALCFHNGDQLIATSSSPCARLDGITKYFTKDGANTWTADYDTDPSDPGYDGCLFMNSGPEFLKTRIYCDEGEIVCPGESGCYRYYMDFNAFECGQDLEHCADSCSCTPISGFYLDFNDLVMKGGEYTPPSGPPVQYLCGCTYPTDPDGCTWPTTISWHVERLIHCCCSNLERDPAPILHATIHGEVALCTGTMEGANGLIYVAGANGCRTWDTPTDISFVCGDASAHTVHISMGCDSTHDDYGECCSDYKMTVTVDGGAPQSAYATSSCSCAPLAMRFGPFTLAACCDDGFYVSVLEYRI